MEFLANLFSMSQVSKTIRLKRQPILVVIALLALAACDFGGQQQVADESTIPTNTLAPIVSMTPRFTATPVPSRTPLPTFTYTPSETPISPTPSDTPTATATPPITGIINSLESVNIREGPGVTFGAIAALPPGTGVQILGQNADRRWYNIRMEDGQEGWVSSQLVRINPTPTLIPTSTPSPDLTALFLGTPLPTAILGGGTITPTPPRSVVTATPPSGTPEDATEVSTDDQSFIPIIDENFFQTATALASGITTVEPSATLDINAINATVTAVSVGNVSVTPGTGPTPDATQRGIGAQGSGGAQSGVDVFAICNDRSLGPGAPTTLRAGATIDVFWAWFARTEEQIQQHIANANYEVRVDGVLLENWREYQAAVRPAANNQFVVYWYVPYGPLGAGEHEITYQVTWTQPISDGSDEFGPGTENPFEQGNCNLTVRE
jgi:uncharacterized protein YraI